MGTENEVAINVAAFSHTEQTHTVTTHTEHNVKNPNGEWRKGACGCFDNMGICLTTCCVPCVPFHFIQRHLQKRGAIGNALIFSILFALAYSIPFILNVMTTLYDGSVKPKSLTCV